MQKTAVITGTSGLLGRSLVSSFIKKGYFVIGLDKINKLENQKNFLYLKCDISNEKNIIKTFNFIEKNKFNFVTLINNAAIDHKVEGKKGFNFIRHKLSDWRKVMSINIDAMFLVSKYSCKIFEKNNFGNIINVSSSYGIVAPDNSIYKSLGKFKKSIDYPTSKSAVIGFTKSLASYYVNTKIRVNCICPGGIYNNQDKQFIKNYSKRTILGRMAKVEEISNAISYLASDESSYMTGSIVVVDGGWSTI